MQHKSISHFRRENVIENNQYLKRKIKDISCTMIRQKGYRRNKYIKTYYRQKSLNG